MSNTTCMQAYISVSLGDLWEVYASCAEGIPR